jgi:uncharacterized protein YcbX
MKIGTVEGLFRYPVKSMAGEPLAEAALGWHGLAGDRRLGLRRVGEQGGFPWLTASRLPELIRFQPMSRPAAGDDALPTHVRTPDGEELDVFGPPLAAEIARRYGAPVEMLHLNRGIFDEASVSVITDATIGEIASLSAQPADVRRFRPNVLLSSASRAAFEEDAWVGGVLTFGDGPDAAAIGVTNWDERCAMVNLDPETARPNAEVLKAIVRTRNNLAGVYATVTRRGRLAVGMPVYFEPAAGV